MAQLGIGVIKGSRGMVARGGWIGGAMTVSLPPTIPMMDGTGCPPMTIGIIPSAIPARFVGSVGSRMEGRPMIGDGRGRGSATSTAARRVMRRAMMRIKA